ncbi:MAG: helicase [Paraburkholderia sp.]|nr:MAG: helicase [Paraburkholderia sp.]
MERLRAENARLWAVLDAHGIDFQRSLAEPVTPEQSEASRLSTDEKVALFRRLFKGRTDVYPVKRIDSS